MEQFLEKLQKTVFEQMMEVDKDPKKIVEEKGLKQESDPKALEALIDQRLLMITEIKPLNINQVKLNYLVSL